MTYSRYQKIGSKQGNIQISNIIIHNLRLVYKIIEYCEKQNYGGYRFSSDMFPVINHPEINLSLEDLPFSDKIFECLDNLKSKVQSSNLKFSAHPSEYITLTSDKESAIQNSISDLEFHGLFFDLIGLPRDYSCPLNIHCRKDGDPDKLSDIFCSNYIKLSDSVKSRLVIENNDNANGTWYINNLIKYFYDKINIPVTFDVLHHSILSNNISDTEAFDLAYDTWPKNIIPLFHYSEGIDGTKKHKELANSCPKNYNKPVIWDVELKGKDDAINLLIEKYF